MRVLVTGGAGYIGSHTAKRLKAAGHEPIVLDSLLYGHTWAVQWGPFEKGDLADVAFLRGVFDRHAIDAVIHFAANAYVGESMTDPSKYFRNNTFNTLNLLDTMVARGVTRIVFSSTCATYGDPQRIPIDESHPQAPVNPYGESKLFVERILHWYGKAYDLRSVALRYFNASGADPDGEVGEDHDPETHLIPAGDRGGAGQAPAGRRVRERLPDARWHRHPRLHPRHGPGGRPCPGARLSGGRRPEHGHQPGHRARPLCARGDSDRGTGRGIPGAEHDLTPAGRRSAAARRRRAAREGRARLDAAIPRSADNHRARLEVAHETVTLTPAPFAATTSAPSEPAR